MEGDALAVTSDSCGVDDYYAFITEIPVEAQELAIVDISASPSTIRTTVGKTIPLSVIGIRGGIYSNISLDVTKCGFTSTKQGVATVTDAGVVKAVSTGEAQITVKYPKDSDTPLIDVVSITVE